tara:strand:+ start:597 stop:1094 length:498 start_codon:yes stop_codon:yes gene_type:complete
MENRKYRFTYSPNFQDRLEEFATLHRFDPTRQQFKEAWDIWIEQNQPLIIREIGYLTEQGFQNDPYDKMYKSVRYYYRKKPFMQKTPKERKDYITLTKNIRNVMDDHLKNYHELKPEEAFQHFILSDIYKNDVDEEKKRLSQYSLTDNQIYRKLQKTYKNRYYKI